MDELDAFLAERHPALASLARWACALVREADPDLTPRVLRGWDAIAWHHPDAGYVCGVFPRDRAEEVRLLFEHGVRLEDPAGLLEGDGRQTRHVVLREARDDLRPVLLALVRDAVVLGLQPR